MKNAERLIRIMQDVRGLEMPKGPLRDVELSYAQFAVLAGVAQNPGCNLTTLAEQLGLSAPTVSVAIRKLEEGNWVLRKGDEKDARITHLYLSPKAKRIMRDMYKQHKLSADRFLARLNEKEQEQLLSLLEKASQIEGASKANKKEKQ